MHALRGIQNRPVTRATAQVAAQIMLRLFTRHGLAFGDAVLIGGEQAHHKTGGAKTALRSETIHHGLLRRMQDIFSGQG
jgi:hypothetical protein